MRGDLSYFRLFLMSKYQVGNYLGLARRTGWK